MEEKEKRISKEEDSGYGLTADNDSCRLADGDSSEPTDSNSCEPADSDSCEPADSDNCEVATDDQPRSPKTRKYAVCKMPLVKRWVICLCRTKSGKNGAHSCNGRHSRNANFISASVYPVVWQQPSPCYCYFGPLGTSRTRTASCRTSKSSPPSMHRNKLPLSKRTAESSYLPRPPRPSASHWRTEVTSF